MKNWIEYPLTLKGSVVDLISFHPSHFDALAALAREKRIWQFYAYDASAPEKFKAIFDTAMVDLERGTQFPFSIYHKATDRIIGSTRFMDIQYHHKKLEIGTTWLHPDYWGTPVNLECKLLLLTFCFETLATYRVQLKTDENNIRSRKAIEKIGGTFEGILRNDMVREDGTHRHSAYYSIITSEWVDKKKRLSELLDMHLLRSKDILTK
jgi:RimJ/RimL family protein N-acetyltransferase